MNLQKINEKALKYKAFKAYGLDNAKIWYYHYTKDGNSYVSEKQSIFFDKLIVSAIRKALKNKAIHTDIDTAKLWKNKVEFKALASEYISTFLASDYYSKALQSLENQGFSAREKMDILQYITACIWLSAVQGVNACISRLFRDSTRQKALISKETDTETDGTLKARHTAQPCYNGTAHVDKSLDIQGIIGTLSENRQRICSLYMDGYTAVEIAVIMDVSKAYISKETKALRDILGKA